MNFDAFVKDIEDNKWKVYGAEVYENGKLLHSFGDTKGKYDIYSCTKSILSIALGIAWDRGLIDFDKNLFDYIPMDRLNISKEAKDTFSKLSLRRFMTMSVEGFPFRPVSDDYLKEAFETNIKNVDNPSFEYSNFSPYLVGVALHYALGEDLGLFIEENIFKAMEIEGYTYERCPGGYFYSASKMKLSVEDMSKIGNMLLNKGIYKDRRILSEEYINMATSVRQMNKEGGYGFYFWKYRDGFSINGKWKQKCYILPKKNLVITYLSDIKDKSHELLHSMETNILGISDNDKTVVKCPVSD